MVETLHIRSGRESDREALFDICLRTADLGGDASERYSDPLLPGLVWSVPYLELAPEHCFVLDNEGTAVGYIVGTPDTVVFEAQLERQWWPPLRARYRDYRPRTPLDRRVLAHFADPDRTEPALARRYPAHLHINILPEAQAGGWGRRLIETELASLAAGGAPAVHLGVSPRNERAIGFYRHLGFAPIETEDEGLWLGRNLGAAISSGKAFP